METNPYSAPLVTLVAAPTEAERIRQDHIKHETNIKTIAGLHFIGGAVLLLISLVGLLGSLGSQAVVYLSVTILVGILNIFVGRDLRRFKVWSRWAAVVLAALFILAGLAMLNPFMLVIDGVILYLLTCQKSKMVFSSGYQAIIAATPHIRFRTPVVVWVVLGLLLLIPVVLFLRYALS